jgi:hypothetical protein
MSKGVAFRYPWCNRGLPAHQVVERFSWREPLDEVNGDWAKAVDAQMHNRKGMCNRGKHTPEGLGIVATVAEVDGVRTLLGEAPIEIWSRSLNAEGCAKGRWYMTKEPDPRIPEDRDKGRLALRCRPSCFPVGAAPVDAEVFSRMAYQVFYTVGLDLTRDVLTNFATGLTQLLSAAESKRNDVFVG